MNYYSRMPWKLYLVQEMACSCDRNIKLNNDRIFWTMHMETYLFFKIQWHMQIVFLKLASGAISTRFQPVYLRHNELTLVKVSRYINEEDEEGMTEIETCLLYAVNDLIEWFCNTFLEIIHKIYILPYAFLCYKQNRVVLECILHL